MNKKIYLFLGLLIVLGIILSVLFMPKSDIINKESGYYKFKSANEIYDVFSQESLGYTANRSTGAVMQEDMIATTAESPGDGQKATADYSQTNIQVKGVDEADIIKTDGEYIYLIRNTHDYQTQDFKTEIIIVKEDEIILKEEIDNFSGKEIFIEKDKLILFGSSYHEYNQKIPYQETHSEVSSATVVDGGREQEEVISLQRQYIPREEFTAIKIIDVENKEDIEILKTYEFKGNYKTSRKINQYVYFVIDSYPMFYGQETVPGCSEVAPLYREYEADENKPFTSIVSCNEIGYISPINPSGFITVIGIDLDTLKLEKEVIVGSAQNIYASKNNLYIAQKTYPRYSDIGEVPENYFEETIITKFNLDKGKINFQTTGKVKGYVLNQFSMDEYQDNFRIATTTSPFFGIGRVVAETISTDNLTEERQEPLSKNNLYVLDKDLKVIGSVENIAPGERIYSARFMQDKAYMITFVQVDPLFVIDLKDPENPEILGELKIPGYSNYLHPYSENYLLGIGKEVLENPDPNQTFVFEQGIKLSLFDVTKLENPIEKYKEVIGDRGTYSQATSEYKAFFFDKEKELLIIPITLAQYKEPPENNWEYGRYTYQGMYVYKINQTDGFDLLGRITHSEQGPNNYNYFEKKVVVKRVLYIGDVLYTFSDNRLQLNDLNTLEVIKKIDLD